jgi:ribosome-binding protein aMBF1 (putative translation factor)
MARRYVITCDKCGLQIKKHYTVKIKNKKIDLCTNCLVDVEDFIFRYKY